MFKLKLLILIKGNIDTIANIKILITLKFRILAIHKYGIYQKASSIFVLHAADEEPFMAAGNLNIYNLESKCSFLTITCLQY